jgi:tripartite motif-containing protein 71
MKILFTIFLFPIILFSQSLIFLNDFGNFQNASSFSMDLSGNIFVADISTNTITKLDSIGILLFNIGGFGWEESTFDEPIDIVTNTLSLYVADKNNNRIQRFDKDLNFLSQFSGKNQNSKVEFGYPTCIDISSIGDLYILDSDNNKILKFNLTGEYFQEIGGNDAGSFAISNPKSFTIDQASNLYILDDQSIKVFDQYGNGMFHFQPEFDADKINFYNSELLFIKHNEVIVFDIANRKIKFTFSKFPEINNENIVDVILNNNRLFVLTQKRILKYLIKQ